MKTLIILIMPFILFASGQTLSTSDYMFLMNLDKKPFKQRYENLRMHKLHNVDEQEAKDIAKKLTDEESKSVELKRDGKYLIYVIITQHYRLIINALDASVIEKSQHKEQ